MGFFFHLFIASWGHESWKPSDGLSPPQVLHITSHQQSVNPSIRCYMSFAIPECQTLTCGGGPEEGRSARGVWRQGSNDGGPGSGGGEGGSSGRGALRGWQIVFLQLQQVGISSGHGPPAHLQCVGAGPHQLYARRGRGFLCKESR